MKLSEKAQAALNVVMDKFAQGNLSDMVQALAIVPTDNAPCRGWTFANRALIAAQKYTIDARGFAQWREVGRKVKKGATAGYIFAPNMRPTDTKGEDGKKVYQLRGWHPIPVFAVQDTEPIDPAVPSNVSYAPVKMPPLFEVAQALGLSVEYAPHGGKANGSYRMGPEQILLHVTTHRTFWHELAHAAHHHVDVVDFMPFDDRKETIAYREAVAELTAAVLGEMYGEPCAGTSYKYLLKYYDDPLFGISQALRIVGKVLDLMMSLVEESDGEEIQSSASEPNLNSQG